jgi:hypothetical protein
MMTKRSVTVAPSQGPTRSSATTESGAGGGGDADLEVEEDEEVDEEDDEEDEEEDAEPSWMIHPDSPAKLMWEVGDCGLLVTWQSP